MSKTLIECQQYKFSSHAIQRMFERAIQKNEAITVIQHGEIIAEYPDDKPYSSYLVFAFVDNRPIHVLTALDLANKICYIVTVYVPDPKIWLNDFKTRRIK